jgi:tRNA A37 threonylcarbamoyltransferase TsaD
MATQTSTYASITNKMQRYTMVFITINDLHVSGGSSTHQQELKTVFTASGICQAFSASYRRTQLTQLNSLMIAVRSRKSLTNTRCRVYSFELLMMGGGTARNM